MKRAFLASLHHEICSRRDEPVPNLKSCRLNYGRLAREHQCSFIHYSLAMTLFVLLITAPAALFAQNVLTGNLTWTSDDAVNQANNAALHYRCTFTTQGSASVKWSQPSRNTTFSTSAASQWGNVQTDGQVVYTVQDGNLTGTITFKRTNGNATVHLKLFVDGNPDLDYLFFISTVATAP
jgi:hypothetical protein